jgi:glycosyltransferase involved in cell wall biosynthesis
MNSPLKTVNTDIFWSPHYNVPIINFASKVKVVTIHDVFHLAYYRTLSLGQKMYARLMVNRAVDSDVIFTVSQFSKSEIVKYTSCNPKKIKVIYNGVDFEKFNKRFDENRKNVVLSTYQISSRFILFVGNVKPHKNLKTALLGFKELLLSSAKFSDYKFVIVGKREGFITGDKQLDSLLSDPFFNHKVQFTGWVQDEDLPVLYQAAATFVFPSVYEGFGFPPLEAMAAGCPVISSNAACMPEVYEDAALYFDPLNPVEIAKVLDEVLTDSWLRAALIKKGLNQAKKYDWQKTGSEEIKYLKQCG